MLEKVASIQFDSDEEIGRRLNLDELLPPCPFEERQQKIASGDAKWLSLDELKKRLRR